MTKGAPEELLARCVRVPESTRAALDAELDAGSRVVAVASRPAPGLETIDLADERDLDLAGFLVFLDAPKPDARPALEQLSRLPSQILLNNLIYDLTQVAIPADRVDDEQLARPAHWDLREIKRFMLTFGPVSSLFDFLTFAILLGVLHAGPSEFRSGWFVESLATQTLVVFVIRTRRSPPWRSRPAAALVATVLAGVAVAGLLPYTPLAGPLGFTALPPVFLLVMVALVGTYLALVEGVKRLLTPPAAVRVRTGTAGRRIHRRAARFTIPG